MTRAAWKVQNDLDNAVWYFQKHARQEREADPGSLRERRAAARCKHWSHRIDVLTEELEEARAAYRRRRYGA